MTTLQKTDLAEALALHAATTPVAAIPDAVFDHLDADVTDSLSACIGGLHAPGVDATRDVIGESVRAGVAVVFGTKLRWPAAFAAQVNATAGHALDFDDVLDEGGSMHAGVPTLCAALAVADERGGVSGRELLAAVAVGLDVAVRLALAPSEDYGWHRTSAFGIFGATVAAGRLAGLNALQMRNALGIAYSQASGNRQCIADGALSKRLQSGFAARDAVTAVRLAQRGLTGAHRIFEGSDGFFNLYQRGRYDRDIVLNGLGADFLSRLIAIKPFPCGRPLHGYIDAALTVRGRAGGRRIDRVEVGVGEPRFSTLSRAYPQDVVQAQFSVPFAVALALDNGALSVADFDRPAEAAAGVRALFARTELVPLTGADQKAFQVTVWFEDGSEERASATVLPGHPTRPVTPAQLRAKFLDCCGNSGGAFDGQRAERVLNLALNLRSVSDTRELTGALAAG